MEGRRGGGGVTRPVHHRHRQTDMYLVVGGGGDWGSHVPYITDTARQLCTWWGRGVGGRGWGLGFTRPVHHRHRQTVMYLVGKGGGREGVGIGVHTSRTSQTPPDSYVPGGGEGGGEGIGVHTSRTSQTPPDTCVPGGRGWGRGCGVCVCVCVGGVYVGSHVPHITDTA